MVFKCLVLGALFSGLSAFCLGTTDYDAFDKFIQRCGRRLLCGRAVTKEGEHFVNKGAIFVWRFLGMAPSRIEMRIQRLHLWQGVARRHEEHDLLLTIVFGKVDKAGGRVLDEEGRLLSGANPWAKQLLEDIQCLGEFDDFALFV